MKIPATDVHFPEGAPDATVCRYMTRTPSSHQTEMGIEQFVRGMWEEVSSQVGSATHLTPFQSSPLAKHLEADGHERGASA